MKKQQLKKILSNIVYADAIRLDGQTYEIVYIVKDVKYDDDIVLCIIEYPFAEETCFTLNELLEFNKIEFCVNDLKVISSL